MLNLIRSCFTWDGRVDRADFCAGMLGLAIVTTAFLGITWADIYFHKIPQIMAGTSFMVCFVIVWLLLLFLELSLFVRRFHDMGKPGNRVWLLLVPFLNFYYLAILFFGKSAEDPNDPKTRSVQ